MTWVLPVLVCAPWAVAIAWYWRRLPRDGWVPLSAGEAARRRLSVR